MPIAGGVIRRDNEINTAALNYINNQIVNLNPKPDLVFFLGDMATVAYDANGKRLLPDWKNLMELIRLFLRRAQPGENPALRGHRQS